MLLFCSCCCCCCCSGCCCCCWFQFFIFNFSFYHFRFIILPFSIFDFSFFILSFPFPFPFFLFSPPQVVFLFFSFSIFHFFTIFQFFQKNKKCLPGPGPGTDDRKARKTLKKSKKIEKNGPTIRRPSDDQKKIKKIEKNGPTIRRPSDGHQTPSDGHLALQALFWPQGPALPWLRIWSYRVPLGPLGPLGLAPPPSPLPPPPPVPSPWGFLLPPGPGDFYWRWGGPWGTVQRAVPAADLVLGCSKCRYSKKGCADSKKGIGCRNPAFKGKRGHP